MILRRTRRFRLPLVARPIMPPMPWPAHSRLTDDLHALFAYLRSIPPVHNRVPERQPAEQAAKE